MSTLVVHRTGHHHQLYDRLFSELGNGYDGKQSKLVAKIILFFQLWKKLVFNCCRDLMV